MACKRTKRQIEDADKLTDHRAPKTVWHPLNLQRVPLGRFVDVVNQILQGKLALFDSSLKHASISRELDDPALDRGDASSPKK